MKTQPKDDYFNQGWNDARNGRVFDPPPPSNSGRADYQEGFEAGRNTQITPRLAYAAPDLLDACIAALADTDDDATIRILTKAIQKARGG